MYGHIFMKLSGNVHNEARNICFDFVVDPAWSTYHPTDQQLYFKTPDRSQRAHSHLSSHSSPAMLGPYAQQPNHTCGNLRSLLEQHRDSMVKNKCLITRHFIGKVQKVRIRSLCGDTGCFDHRKNDVFLHKSE